MAGRLPKLVRDWGPWLLAGALWAVSVLSCASHIQPDFHGLVDASAVVASFWVIARHYRGGPRLKPGERVISDEELFGMEAAITRGVMSSLPGDQAGGFRPRPLRSAR